MDSEVNRKQEKTTLGEEIRMGQNAIDIIKRWRKSRSFREIEYFIQDIQLYRANQSLKKFGSPLHLMQTVMLAIKLGNYRFVVHLAIIL
ncbi:hypothetical protein NPIL_342021 [Nephila pilipes]|uniref:Uncharacterized protein n=1 Tax=Nephila pilipes TaxID=299642 RepID=A0A8X6QWW2_NEPPI|nr:hypothetical protein NPIL_342021 [Nephila pilipes]